MKRRLRIAVWHNLPSGGGKRALYGHVKGLLERGHHLEAWCPPQKDDSYLPLSKLIAVHEVPLDAMAMKEGGRWSAPFASSIMRRRLAAMDGHCCECARQITAGEFDVLFANACVYFRTSPLARHLQMPSALYLGEPYRWLYEALPRLPWVALDDNGWSLQSLRRHFADWFHTHALRIQMREEIANASAFDRILVNSLYSRESVLRAYGLESSVCYLGIDTKEFQPTGEATERYVLGLGSLTFAKGPDRAIRAVGKVPKSKRPALLWVGNISDSTYERELRSLADESGVEFSVKVLVSDAELLSILSRASLLLYTSRLEPFGLAPLEANACGCPVVAIAEGGVREIVHDGLNGVLVDGNEPVALAQAIERVMDDAELSARLRRQALAYVREKWPLSGGIDRLENLLWALSDKRDVSTA